MENNNILIREMTDSDIEKVCRIEKEAFSDAWDFESFRYTVKAKHDYSIVAESDGEIEGYAILRTSFDTADIINIAVDKENRQKGIAGKLMQKLLSYGDSTGVISYMLEVREHNTAALRLYLKFCFEIIGVRENYYSNPVENAFVMKRKIM